jgi:predicted Zn-dependent protease
MEARSEATPYVQVQDSLDFQLVRARLRARENSPADAVSAARSALQDKRYSSEIAARYELASALLRARQLDEAELEVQKLLPGADTRPMIQQLAAQIALTSGNATLALRRYQTGSQSHPDYRPLQYGYISALLATNLAGEALARVDKELALYPDDRRLWLLAANTHAQLGHRLLSHLAQAEASALSGNLIAAVEQANLGIKASDGSFHEMSAAEARRREWQALEKAQRKE